MFTKRKIIKGFGVSSGIALGRTWVVTPGHMTVAEVVIPASRVNTEIAALEKAIVETISELSQLRDSAGKKMGGSVPKIFDAQLLIANDQEFLSRVRKQIGERRRNAGFVYNSLVQETTLQLKRSSDPYLRQMVQEIEAVSKRVLSHLSGFGKRSVAKLPENTIVVSKTLSSGEVLYYRHRRAIGFLTAEGGADSHMALIARSLTVPMTVIDAAWASIPNNCRVIVDGTNGQVIVNPSDKDWTEYQRKRKRQGPATIKRIKKLTQIPPLTADGVPVPISANLEFPGPVDDVLSAQKIPIGLYRTEFLYLDGDEFPDEETQYQFYWRIADKYAQTQVILRTFDLGSDKVKADWAVPKEDNPAMGWRGIRCMLELPRAFKTQIKAILRASVHKNIRILLPMISDISELRKARRIISQAMLELRRKGIPYDHDIHIGIMIEVPSAALMADQLIQKVDFVSIGSNDLTQYTMAADRSNTKVAGLYNSFHPAVLKLIRTTVEACKRHGKPAYICGEVAGNPLALPLFVGMGVSGLSMNPSKILDICRLVKKIDSNLVRHLVGPVVSSNSASAVVRKLESYRNALIK